MNYRHAYHAGNFADVLKHVVLLALVEHLKEKDTPFCYVDTHAGSGLYALDGTRARKTSEYLDGIARLARADGLPPLVARYRDGILATDGNDQGLRNYPGSPLQVARLLRDVDSARLCELQPDEAATLRRRLHHDRRFHVHERDGYEALGALLPPREKRGLVLIDPPYEAQEAEYRLIASALATALHRWPTGIYAIWYPIKLRSGVQPFLHGLTLGPARRVLQVELLLHAANTPLRLNGAGVAIVNAPWRLDQVLRAPVRALANLLGQDGPAQDVVAWLRNDDAPPLARTTRGRAGRR